MWSAHAVGIAITEDGRGHISQHVTSNMEWAFIDVYVAIQSSHIIKLLKDIQMV